MKNHLRRTCIYHDGALGDVLLSLACLRDIGRDAGPVDFIGRADAGRLLAAGGLVRRSWSSSDSMFASWYSGAADADALGFLGRYDRAFVFTVREGSDLVTTIGKAVPDTRTIITIPSGGVRTHVADFRLRQLSAAFTAGGRGGLDIPAALRERARDILIRAGWERSERLIVLHPGSGGTRKCWPLDRYVALAERLSARVRTFVLFLSGTAEGPAMRERIDRFTAGRSCMAHVADADLTEVAGLLVHGGLFIGNDSGISHLAASVGTPVVVLFGPTDPALWRPCGTVRVLAAETLEGISVDAVLAAAEQPGVDRFRPIPLSI